MSANKAHCAHQKPHGAHQVYVNVGVNLLVAPRSIEHILFSLGGAFQIPGLSGAISNCKQPAQTAGRAGCVPRAMQALICDPIICQESRRRSHSIAMGSNDALYD
jgi:hypothetical protein